MRWKGIFLLQKPPPIWNALRPVDFRLLWRPRGWGHISPWGGGCSGGQDPCQKRSFWNEWISYKLDTLSSKEAMFPEVVCFPVISIAAVKPVTVYGSSSISIWGYSPQCVIKPSSLYMQMGLFLVVGLKHILNPLIWICFSGLVIFRSKCLAKFSYHEIS